MDKKVISVNEAVSKLTSYDDVCLIQLYDEQLDTFKVELDDIYWSVLNSDELEDKELSIQQTELAQKLFDCSLVVKRLLENNSPIPTSTPTREGIKLPKIDVPSFDVNILHWQTFLDQFCISIHHHTNLSEAEKLVYLQQALKNGSGKRSIEGLSQSGDCYAEAISCLKSQYD